jgi:hypothetical protein
VGRLFKQPSTDGLGARTLLPYLVAAAVLAATGAILAVTMSNKDGVTTGALKTSVKTQKSLVTQDSPDPPEQSGRSVFGPLFSQVDSPICVTVQLI